jgi:hypothetical protein
MLQPLMGSAFQRSQTGRLGFQMAGHLGIQPAADLCRQINDFDCHSLSPLKYPGSVPANPDDAPIRGVEDRYSMSR